MPVSGASTEPRVNPGPVVPESAVMTRPSSESR